MLERLRVQNFRLLRDVDLTLAEGAPTVLIGPNGAGKSSVLEVLDFLQRCATVGLQDAVVAHGGIHSIQTIGAVRPVVVESWWKEPDSRTSARWRFEIGATKGGRARVRAEEVASTAFWGDTSDVSTDADGVRWLTDGDEPHVKVEDDWKLAFETFSDPHRYMGLGLLRDFVSSMSVLGSIDCAPPWRRADSGSRRSPRDSVVVGPRASLAREGLGLANALFTLFNDQPAEWSELTSAYQAEFPNVARIVFPADAGGSRIGFGVEDRRFPGRKLYASELSDGMINYLCLLVALLSPYQGEVVALDEPDANIHPSALRRLMALAHRQASKRRVLIVTHSNALLDELQDPAESIRIVESTAQGARIQRLDAAALATWRDDYTISALRKTGLLDASNGSAGAEH